MNEKKMKESQKKLVKQRDEARAAAEKLPSVEAALVEMTSARDGLRAEVGRLEAAIDHLDKEREQLETRNAYLKGSLDKAVADATNDLKQQLALKDQELSSMKMEDVKALRKRLQAKTEQQAQLIHDIAERDKLLGTLMRLPAVRQFIEEAKKRAAALEAKAEPPKVPNPDNANGAADQPSFPAPTQQEGAAP